MAAVANTQDDPLYHSYSTGTYSYDIAVPEAGTYVVELFLAETYWNNGRGARLRCGVGRRGEGELQRYRYLCAQRRPVKALRLFETVAVTDGVLDIDVISLVNNGLINGFTVSRVDAPPPAAAANDAATVAEDGSVLVNVLANDAAGAVLVGAGTAAGVAAPAHGSVAVEGTQVRYTPNADYFGSDSFEYAVSTPGGGTAKASVAVTVTGVNDAPRGIALANSTVAETAGPGTVIGQISAFDPDGDALVFGVTGDPRFAVNGSGNLVVAQGADLSGVGDRPVTLTLSASDGKAPRSPHRSP